MRGANGMEGGAQALPKIAKENRGGVGRYEVFECAAAPVIVN